MKKITFRITYTAKKMKFYIKDLFSKCDQIRSFLRIWSHLLKKSLVQNIFCAVTVSDWMAGTSLTHSFPKHSFSTPWNHQKTVNVHWERLG